MLLCVGPSRRLPALVKVYERGLKKLQHLIMTGPDLIVLAGSVPELYEPPPPPP